MGQQGQGAVEYLMTYGWAILVVVSVCLVLWELGLFTFGGNTPVSSTGFQALKPLLSTCRIQEAVWGQENQNGFSCQFVNTLKKTIYLNDVGVTVNSKTCQNMAVSDSIIKTGDSSELTRTCKDENGDCKQLKCKGSQCANNELILVQDSQVTVLSYSNNGFHNSHPEEPCNDIDEKQVYAVDVTLTYNLTLGGESFTKTSKGAIRLQGG